MRSAEWGLNVGRGTGGVGGVRSEESAESAAFNAHWFQLFNAVAFQIMMGAPIILFAQSLGASSTVLGIVAAFTPLMAVLQLPAARFLGRFSYREFVMKGWGLRTVFIFAVAVVPLLEFLSPGVRIGILLGLLFCFNALRGISSAGWMPWIAAIIPSEKRGRFLALDQLFMYVGSLFSLGVSAVVMTGRVEAWEYSVVFLVSALGGTLSLRFIKRMPDAPVGEVTARSAQSVPWRHIVMYPPFTRLLVFNVLFMVVIGGLGVFTVEYLRELAGFGADVVLALATVAFVGPIVSLMLTGRVIDRVGSKPVLRLALGGFLVVLTGWFLIAAGVWPATIGLVAGLNFLSGLAGANFNLANLRITMETMPEMGRNHFFALFTVITSMGLGAAPVVWGVSLDAIGTYEAVTGWFSWRRHSIYFAALFGINVVAFLAVNLLRESRRPAEEGSLIYARLRRFVGRLMFR